MILDLQANHFILPAYTTYNHAHIPFAYPQTTIEKYAARQKSCFLKKRHNWFLTHTTASIIRARNIKAKYMLDQRYIVQATLLPGIFHTRQAA
jgi:hypothetical protein